MDRDILEQRFLSRVEKLRRESRWFPPVGLLISMALIIGSGLAIEWLLEAVSVRAGLRLPLTLGFLGLLLLYGLWVHRRRIRTHSYLERLGSAAVGNRISFFGGRRRGVDWLLWESDLVVIAYLLT